MMPISDADDLQFRFIEPLKLVAGGHSAAVEFVDILGESKLSQ